MPQDRDADRSPAKSDGLGAVSVIHIEPTAPDPGTGVHHGIVAAVRLRQPRDPNDRSEWQQPGVGGDNSFSEIVEPIVIGRDLETPSIPVPSLWPCPWRRLEASWISGDQRPPGCS